MNLPRSEPVGSSIKHSQLGSWQQEIPHQTLHQTNREMAVKNLRHISNRIKIPKEGIYRFIHTHVKWQTWRLNLLIYYPTREITSWYTLQKHGPKIRPSVHYSWKPLTYHECQAVFTYLHHIYPTPQRVTSAQSSELQEHTWQAEQKH